VAGLAFRELKQLVSLFYEFTMAARGSSSGLRRVV
jgi:hypothetical protein